MEYQLWYYYGIVILLFALQDTFIIRMVIILILMEWSVV